MQSPGDPVVIADHEIVRRIVTPVSIADLGLDLRHAVRSLRGTPATAAAAMLVLALGLAGATSMFTLVHGVLLRPLPVPDEERVVVGWRALPEAGARRWPFQRTELELLGDQSRLFAAVAGVGYNDGQLPLVDGGEASYAQVSRVTGDFFKVLGVAALIGRTLGPSDDVTGAGGVLVVTHAYWQRRYGGAPDVLGRRVTIGGQPFTIVGVMPRDVQHPREVDAWMTVSAKQTTTSNPTSRQAMVLELNLIARLNAGVSAAQVSAELESLGRQLDERRPAGEQQGYVIALQPLRDAVLGDARPALWVLFAAVALVLVIATANVGNLLLVRGEARLAEWAVRAAIGAGRARIIRQAVVESAVLTVVASMVGLLVAWWTLPVVLSLAPGGLPRADAIAIDWRVVAFVGTVALVTSCLTGAIPAWVATCLNLGDYVRVAGPGHVAPAARRARRGLVIVQVALAVAGIAAAGLLTRSLHHLELEAQRLASGDLVHVPLELPQDRYADRQRLQGFMTDLTASLHGTPPVVAATPINVVPFSGNGWDVPTFTAEAQTPDQASANPTLNLEEIQPGYFETFAVRLTKGRTFTRDDRTGTPRVAIISDDVAARTWPGSGPDRQAAQDGAALVAGQLVDGGGRCRADAIP